MAVIEKAECKLRDHMFSDKFTDNNVNFYVISLKDSFILWVGDSTPKLTNLAVAMQTQYDATPSGSSVLGDPMDTTSTGLAQRLAKKTNKQVFVSYNLSAGNAQLLPLVEKRILTEMTSFPEKF